MAIDKQESAQGCLRIMRNRIRAAQHMVTYGLWYTAYEPTTQRVDYGLWKPLTLLAMRGANDGQ